MDARKLLLLSLFWTSAHAAEIPGAVVQEDYRNDGNYPQAQVALGQALFFDKILSGNKNISCATCHHPEHFSSDAISLSVGEGGTGLGPNRTGGSGATAANTFTGRHSPVLFNLGAREYSRMNWDGRMEDTGNGFNLPCRGFRNTTCPDGLDNILAAQNLFPLATAAEMTGTPAEAEISLGVPRTLTAINRFPAVWTALVDRLRVIPGYTAMFAEVYGVEPSGIKITHVVNAMAAFQSVAFRSDNSPFDDYLRGNEAALGEAEVRGMELFYGKADCASCHSGKFQTDHAFHAIAMPQAGPGVNVVDRSSGQRDVGRYGVTGNTADKMKFRTPTLRNVALTAPYGHDGAYATLEGVVRHHTAPLDALASWDSSQLIFAPLARPLRNPLAVMLDPVKLEEIVVANELAPTALSDGEISDLLAFLGALTDSNVTGLTSWVPESVPSGLPVQD